MEVTIRQAEMSDIEEIAAIEAICFPPAEAASKEVFKKRIQIFFGSFFVAVKEGKLIGFINGSVMNEAVITDDLFEDATLHVPNGAYQTILGLDVLPNDRQQGVAAHLMNHMIDISKVRHRKGVILTCKEALIPYYKKFGFVNKGVSNSVHGGATWYDMILYLS